MATHNVEPLFNDLIKREQHNKVACEECSLYRLCLPLGLNTDDLEKLDKIISRSEIYSRNQPLFNVNSDFDALYVVRSGSFKTIASLTNGREQVTGFYFPGEFIGLDAIHEQSYQSTARAMESSTVCALPYENLQEIGKQIPQLQIQLMSRLSKELSTDKNLMMSLGKKTAEEKLATFLLSLAKRFKERGFSQTEFQLTMSRADIANHLGLAVETVSRLFTRFNDEGLIQIDGKLIGLRDLDQLEALCG
jgi:CRP/FNR family transcriptional regulator